MTILVIGVDLADGQLQNGDPDDTLRALQIRTLLDGWNWYDLALPVVRGPDVYLSPWSRLVDLPYAVIAFFLQHLTGREQALRIAFNIWPPAMAVVYALLAVGILRRIAPGKAELPVPLLLGLPSVMMYAIWEFSPGRIDHHNVQILLLLCVIYGLVRFDRAGGILLGIGVSAIVAVGLETLPLLALCLIVLVAAWSLGMPGSRLVLQAAGLACAATALLAMVLLIRPSDYGAVHGDAFSAPFVAALVGFGLVAAGMTAIFRDDSFLPAKGFAFLVSGSTVLAGIIWLFPAFLHGPYTMIDEVTRLYWFERIDQEKSALLFLRSGDLIPIMLLAGCAAIVFLNTAAAGRSWVAGKPLIPILWVIAVGALFQVLASNRFLRVSVAIVPLLLPVAYISLRQAFLSPASQGRAMLLAAIAVTPIVAALLLHFALPAQPRSFDAFDYLLMNACKGEDFSAVATLPAARIMAPPALGLELTGHIPDHASVSSIPYHRSSPAIGRLLKTFMVKAEAERRALLADFDYLAICRSPRGLPGEAQFPLFAALMAGENVPGLTSVPMPSPTRLMLFRIEHAKIGRRL